MKYCVKCGWELKDYETSCPNCGTQVGATTEPTAYTATYYNDVPVRTVNKTTQTIIKVFLILTIIGIVLSAGQYFLSGALLGSGNSEIIDIVLEEMYDFEDMLENIDRDQLGQVLQTMMIVYGVGSLIPLCWVLPMRKKILKAMKEMGTLTTGFKVCTLLFVNLVVGIVLLCSKEI